MKYRGPVAAVTGPLYFCPIAEISVGIIDPQKGKIMFIHNMKITAEELKSGDTFKIAGTTFKIAHAGHYDGRDWSDLSMYDLNNERPLQLMQIRKDTKMKIRRKK
jgi:hypothetical protein